MRRFLLSLPLTCLTAAVLLTVGCAGPQKTAPTATVTKNTYRVRTPLLNLLDCPSNTCPVLQDLHEGDMVTVITVIPEGWSQVRAEGSGREGFVLTRFLGR